MDKMTPTTHSPASPRQLRFIAALRSGRNLPQLTEAEASALTGTRGGTASAMISELLDIPVPGTSVRAGWHGDVDAVSDTLTPTMVSDTPEPAPAPENPAQPPHSGLSLTAMAAAIEAPDYGEQPCVLCGYPLDVHWCGSCPDAPDSNEAEAELADRESGGNNYAPTDIEQARRFFVAAIDAYEMEADPMPAEREQALGVFDRLVAERAR